MTERNFYQELLEATKDGYGIIDAYTMHTWAILAEQGQDVNSIALPMLAMIRESGFETLKQKVHILSRMNNIVALTATPAQLLEIIDTPEVLALEASRSGGSFDN